MLLDKIKWLGQASFRIENKGKVIYIDPWKIKNPQKADVIFITHEHFDHFSSEDIENIVVERSYLVMPFGVEVNIRKKHNLIRVKPGDTKEIDGIRFSTVKAYNINKNFHPKLKAWVGYIIELDGEKIYHAGDTDLIPEMEEINADIALLPVGGTYTMDVDEALLAAQRVKAKVLIPMHFDITGESGNRLISDLRKKIPGYIELKILPVSN